MNKARLTQLIKAIRNDDWAYVKNNLLKFAASDKAEPTEAFHSVWTYKGHRIREQINNDDVLRDALRVLLPPYSGPGMKLYRGENLTRWKENNIGFGWTPHIDIGRMFAGGLNAIYTGGVLLEAYAPSEAIIAGPNEHSKSLDENEYVVDLTGIGNISNIESFPRS